ncbi:MAG: metallophosphoesterase [Candidimonas sp.]
MDFELRPKGKKRFSFVVVADTHINQDEHSSSSPYVTNTMANSRARQVFLEIAAMPEQPKFVIHLGDIVNPVPSLPTFDVAVAHFKDIIKPVKVPVHVLPGNHDVGDKRIEWMPADQVCDSFLEKYRACFGDDFFSFDEDGVRFVLINSLLINSGLEDERRQQAWLERQFEAARAEAQRVFMFMHYPPYIYSPKEKGNYDNLDEPGRSWLLGLMARPEAEAVFAGHVHNFWYDRVGGSEFYMLPSTAFLRHDFSEFFRSAPEAGDEFGRGDLQKFGYAIVDVYDSGHVCYSVRSNGRHADVGQSCTSQPMPYLTHPKVSGLASIGVELRHPWAESVQITSTGGVQEFGRKWARNDYPLQALWEMGASLAKVPDIDLTENESRRRMRVLAAVGHQFIVTCIGMPKQALLDVDLKGAGVIAFEANLTAQRFAQATENLAAIRREHGVKIFYAKLFTADPSQYDGKHFSHAVRSGFELDELDRHIDAIGRAVENGVIDGITVRLGPDQCLQDAARRMQAFHDRTGAEVLASLKLAGPGIATERADDAANVASVAHAMVLAATTRGIRFVYDTFMDVDRGYFPRHAFIDRRYNPRPMARAFTALMAILGGGRTVRMEQGGDESWALRFSVESVQYGLGPAQPGAAATRLHLLDASGGNTVDVIDLMTGMSLPLETRQHGAKAQTA